MEYVRKDLVRAYLQCGRNKALSADVIHGLIEQIPVADVREVKHGHWERHNTYHGDDTSGFIDPDWRCSECGRKANVNEWFMYDLTDFCPNCGAIMDEASE